MRQQEEEMPDWKHLSDQMTRLLRLRSTPVAVRFCRSADELSAGVIPSAQLAACQMVRMSAFSRVSLACPADAMGCDWARVVFGFLAPTERIIAHHAAQFGASPQAGALLVEIKPRLPVGEYAGVLTGALDAWDIADPDVVVFIADGLQSMALSDAAVHLLGDNVAYSAGAGSGVCAFAIVRPMMTGRPNWVAPCRGARRLGAFQDHDLLFAVPGSMLPDVLSHAQEMERAGVWPIPSQASFLSPRVPADYLLRRE